MKHSSLVNMSRVKWKTDKDNVLATGTFSVLYRGEVAAYHGIRTQHPAMPVVVKQLHSVIVSDDLAKQYSFMHNI